MAPTIACRRGHMGWYRVGAGSPAFGSRGADQLTHEHKKGAHEGQKLMAGDLFHGQFCPAPRRPCMTYGGIAFEVVTADSAVTWKSKGTVAGR